MKLVSTSQALRREALVLDYELKIDPKRLLDPEERRQRAEKALYERFRGMGKKSGESRRKRAALLQTMLTAGGER